MENRPRGRETHVTGKGSVNRRGSGLGTGPVGGGRGGSSSGDGNRSGGGGRSPLSLIIIIVIALLGGGGGLSTFLGGGSSGSYQTSGTTQQYTAPLLGGSSTSSNGGWTRTANTGKLDTSVAAGAREKRTTLKGNGKDTVTIMVYMCGTDLESRSGMATSDLQEMAEADLSDNVNIIVYTGGCTSWRNRVVSSKVNQIYQVKNGGLKCLKENAGNDSMTDPSTLAGFIKWCDKNYPADRSELILWDHGGGSLSGYGYDEKNRTSGSMTLSGINKALKNAGVTFDFIGFDACLMATVETALMLDDYADYLIASEETEPGVGWYYTDWLTALSKNTSMSTVEMGKNIIDGFVDTCARKCPGQKTTLSIIDLAELTANVPSAMTTFAKSTSELIQEDQFKTVSSARYGAREFAQSSQIDQIDLVHFADNLGTEEGDKLADAILGSVKYNRTSSNMTNAYGLSIYFPYKKISKVDTAVNTYKSIGMDDDYARCIQQFASMEVSGQSAAGGSAASSPLPSLLGGYGNSGSTSGNSGSTSANTGNTSGNTAGSYTISGSDAITQLLTAMLTGQLNVDGLDSSNTGFLTGRSLDTEDMAEYIALNQFDPSNLVWTEGSDGQKVISLSEAQWGLVTDICLSAYYDDGEGYVDLGLDNVYKFDKDGNLIGDIEGTWVAINGQTVPYYFDSTVDDGENYTISGHVPVMLNGERANLMIEFDNENPHGQITGAEIVYEEKTTETIAKNLVQLEEGDTLDFICDYYSYDGEYQDSYYLGEQMKVTDKMEISNVELEKDKFLPMYRFRDIYQQVYWTEVF